MPRRERWLATSVLLTQRPHSEPVVFPFHIVGVVHENLLLRLKRSHHKSDFIALNSLSLPPLEQNGFSLAYSQDKEESQVK